MKELTIKNKRLNTDTKDDLVSVTFQHSMRLPEEILKFLNQYQGCRIEENWYVGKDGSNQSLHQFLYIKQHEIGASIEAILEGNKYYGYKNFFPFAIDPGGWVFNISFAAETNGQVWIDKFDSGDENPLEFVCDSFDEFINGLQKEEP